VIETERLLLRKPEPDDALAVYRVISDREVMRWISPTGEPGTFDDAVERVERWRRGWDVDGFGHFMIARQDTGMVVGRVGLLCWEPDFGEHGTRSEIGDDAEIELGWTIERAAWGRGFATEAALAARDWALEAVTMRRLISLIHPENTRSLRVAEKIGERYQQDIVVHHGATVQLWQLASQS
jgi:RimJ/RimL family protein N-acetyltransferase